LIISFFYINYWFNYLISNKVSCVFLDYEAVSLLWFCYSVVVEDAGEESLGFYWAWMVGNLIESKSLIKAFFYPSITVNFFSNYAIFTR